MKPCSLFLLLILAAAFLHTLHARPYDYPTAERSTLWTNNASLQENANYPDGSMVRAILVSSSFGPGSYFGPTFACGFFCTAPCDSFLFAVFIVFTNSGSLITMPTHANPQVVWSANRDRPVRENATLQFARDGNLILRDADNTAVWSANTSGGSAVRMLLSDAGNLMLVDKNNASVWASFDQPTDSLVLGQSLREGRRLTANVSPSNATEGQLFLTLLTDGLYAYVGSNPPQLYYENEITVTKAQNRSTYITFTNGSLAQPGSPDPGISLPQTSSLQYMRFEPDGHLRIYDWDDGSGWKMLGDVLDVYLGDCAYPTVCGAYGICTNRKCSCPRGADGDPAYFVQVNETQPSLGCAAVTPLSCQSMQDHHLLALNNISYFNCDYGAPVKRPMDEESCKQECLKNCSCKAALFVYGGNASAGSCYLPSQLFSLMNNQPEVSHYNSSMYIKLQAKKPPTAPSPVSGNGSVSSPSSGKKAPSPVSGNGSVSSPSSSPVSGNGSVSSPSSSPVSGNGSVSSPSSGKKSAGVAVILGSILGSIFAGILIVSIIFWLLRRMKVMEEEEEDHFDLVPGMPARFSFEELRVATDNFCTKLGGGGFGSVFEGTLADGMKVAVKRLDGAGQGEREFLAEVETIGSIHHINLVRLIGFCTEKSHRLLVYEYMCNGSLDKWIFCGNSNVSLDWQTRRKIVSDIAKGLSYLHEGCRQKIAHLDIKPQNILLDDRFDAKVSDFGMSKLIDRDQSQVVTRMRGTPGYLAPEWLTSKITEKVDVYSFGVVIMEMLCGRKNLDYSQPEGCIHLISLLQDVVESDRLSDLVDKHNADMQVHVTEVVEMMKLAMWCLQSDCGRRPSMSKVLKALEGGITVEACLDYNFTIPAPLVSKNADYLSASAPPLASVLSGPR